MSIYFGRSYTKKRSRPISDADCWVAIAILFIFLIATLYAIYTYIFG